MFWWTHNIVFVINMKKLSPIAFGAALEREMSGHWLEEGFKRWPTLRRMISSSSLKIVFLMPQTMKPRRGWWPYGPYGMRGTRSCLKTTKSTHPRFRAWARSCLVITNEPSKVTIKEKMRVQQQGRAWVLRFIS